MSVKADGEKRGLRALSGLTKLSLAGVAASASMWLGMGLGRYASFGMAVCLVIFLFSTGLNDEGGAFVLLAVLAFVFVAFPLALISLAFAAITHFREALHCAGLALLLAAVLALPRNLGAALRAVFVREEYGDLKRKLAFLTINAAAVINPIAFYLFSGFTGG